MKSLLDQVLPDGDRGGGDSSENDALNYADPGDECTKVEEFTDYSIRVGHPTLFFEKKLNNLNFLKKS